MRKKPYNITVLLMACGFAAAAMSILADSDINSEGDDREQLEFRDLRKTSIIGELGRPLGTFVTIEGYWQFDRHSEPKGSGLYFVVVKIDNRQLSRVLRYQSSDTWYSSDDLRKKILEPYQSHPFPENLLLKRITLRVCESIAHNGHPEGWLKEAGLLQAAGSGEFELVTKLNCFSEEIAP